MKISNAEKERRKDQKIYSYFDDLLKRLEDCYTKDKSWNDFSAVFAEIKAFSVGCYYADGYKWKKRLNERFEKWLIESVDLRKEYEQRVKAEKRFHTTKFCLHPISERSHMEKS